MTEKILKIGEEFSSGKPRMAYKEGRKALKPIRISERTRMEYS
jgi:hypothetical protein